MKRWLQIFVFLLPLCLGLLNGCGAGDQSASGQPLGVADAGGGSESPVPENPETPSPEPGFSGRAVLLPVVVTPERERADVFQLKAEIEAEPEGLRILGDGKFILFQDSPAVGWIAELGGQTVVLDAEGSFTFDPPADGVTEGVLRHPSDPSLSFPFTVSQLGAARDGGNPILLTMFFRGPCGMNQGDTQEFCGTGARPQPRVDPKIKARFDDPADPDFVRAFGSVISPPTELRPDPRPFEKPRLTTVAEGPRSEAQLVMGRLGTYPKPATRNRNTNQLVNFPSVKDCVQTDGRFQGPSVPKQIAYFLSTCYDYVRAGACLNENALSDAENFLVSKEFVEIVTGLNLTSTSFQGPLTAPVLIRVPGIQSDLHCYQNHKHRNCAMVNLGDVAGELPENVIVRPAGSTPGTATLEVSGRTTITIHNNGAFGITRISKQKSDLGGTLSGIGVVSRASLTLQEVQEVHHYRPVDYVAVRGSESDDAREYVPDEKLDFTPPDNAQPGQEDVYLFTVDDRSIEITFRFVPRAPFLTKLGDVSELTVLDINRNGLMAVARPAGLFLEEVGQADPIQLLSVPGEALLNDDGTCAYQPSDHLSPARIRILSGESVDLPPPAGAQSAFAQGIASLNPDGIFFCWARRGDGKDDLYTFTASETEEFTNLPEGLPNTPIIPLRHCNKDALFASAPGGLADPPFDGISNAGKLCKFDLATRTWSSHEVAPNVLFIPGNNQAAHYVDANTTSVLATEIGNDFHGVTPPAGVTWAAFLTFLVQTGADHSLHSESKILGQGGRTVAITDLSFPAAGGVAGSSHGVIAMNEDFEVLGVLTEIPLAPRPVLFQPEGTVDLVPLLPAGAPAGTWQGLKMGGRYIVLQHTDGAGNSSIYLFFRGS